MMITYFGAFFLSWFHWDPSREAFFLPYFGHPVTWYGIFFAIGFLFAYFIVRQIFTQRLRLWKEGASPGSIKDAAASLTDKLTLYVVVGTIVGARMGEVLFYGFSYYLQHPLDIFKIWEGGLSSHGGITGIVIATVLFHWRIKKEFPFLSILAIIDTVAIPAALTGACIRVGNFFNQEILGVDSTVPWAVIFGHPWNNEAIIPRHPVQLYESISCLLVFALLYRLWQLKGAHRIPGFYTGWCLVLIFSSRFFIEMLKLPQSLTSSADGILSHGQYLSIPVIAAGLFLVIRASCKTPFGGKITLCL